MLLQLKRISRQLPENLVQSKRVRDIDDAKLLQLKEISIPLT
jgi:hypothetical protein